MMGCFLKIISIVILIIMMQMINMKMVFSLVKQHNIIESQNYEPADYGSPEISQGAGRR
jgi:hypothetical protein